MFCKGALFQQFKKKHPGQMVTGAHMLVVTPPSVRLFLFSENWFYKKKPKSFFLNHRIYF